MPTLEANLAKYFLSHLSGEEAGVAASYSAMQFLSHLSGEEVGLGVFG